MSVLLHMFLVLYTENKEGRVYGVKVKVNIVPVLF
jgi:hypothetical protein